MSDFDDGALQDLYRQRERLEGDVVRLQDSIRQRTDEMTELFSQIDATSSYRDNDESELSDVRMWLDMTNDSIAEMRSRIPS